MREHFDTWGWMYAAMAMLTFLAIMRLGREGLCGPASENCFREWVSALSGWAAGAATALTVFFLWRQVADAQRRHRDNALINLWSRRALAKAVVSNSPQYLEALDEHLNDWTLARGLPHGSKIDMSIKTMDEILGDQAFARAEFEIAAPYSSSKSLSERLSVHKTEI